MTDLVLSASSVDSYRRCHYRWFLQYVEMHTGESSIRQAVGSAVHAGVETYYRAVLENDAETGYGDALEVYDLEMIFGTASIADPDEPLDKAWTSGKRTLVAYLEDVAPLVEPEYIEQPFLITVNGIHYSGHFDLADRQRVVRDLKVKSQKPRFTDEYAFAMVGYALGYRTLTGQRERDIQLDVMIRLKRDRPYHVPISNGGPVEDRDIRLFAGTLQMVAAGINRGDYRPTGIENRMCSYCPVRTICEPYQQLKGKN